MFLVMHPSYSASLQRQWESTTLSHKIRHWTPKRWDTSRCPHHLKQSKGGTRQASHEILQSNQETFLPSNAWWTITNNEWLVAFYFTYIKYHWLFSLFSVLYCFEEYETMYTLLWILFLDKLIFLKGLEQHHCKLPYHRKMSFLMKS